jgi:hypothetical protein
MAGRGSHSAPSPDRLLLRSHSNVTQIGVALAEIDPLEPFGSAASKTSACQICCECP